MPNSLTSEIHVDSSGHHEIGHVTIGALCRASDELCPVGRLEKQTRMLGLADGALIDQHYCRAVVTPLVSARKPLEKCFHDLRFPQHAVGQGAPGPVAPVQRRRHVYFVSQPRRNLPGGSIGVTTVVEDYGGTILEFFKHFLDLRYCKAVEICIADVAGQHPHDISVSVALGLRYKFFLARDSDLSHLGAAIADGKYRY